MVGSFFTAESRLQSKRAESAEMDLKVLPGLYAVCRLEATEAIPAWAVDGGLFSVTRTADELSIVCEQDRVPDGIRCERDWRVLKVAGPLDFALVGILASLAGALADAGISLFALSTFDTDYLLVQADAVERAVAALRAAGHRVDGAEYGG